MEYNQKSFEMDGYDFWNDHIKHVFKHSHDLAIKRGGDIEVCELAALFHDMAMVANFGPRAEHEQYGAKMAHSILTELNYPKDKMELVENYAYTDHVMIIKKCNSFGNIYLPLKISSV